MSELQVFDVHGAGWRFGQDESGRAYAVAADVAKTFDYRDARDALRQVDDDEKGTQNVRTPGGPQQMSVIYKDGIWELIFRSSKPEAKAIKKRVKAILNEIEATGRYEVEPMDELEVAEHNVRLIKEKRVLLARAQKAEGELAVAAPKAHAWDSLASAEGDYSLGDAAKIISRDPHIVIGQNRLFDLLGEWGWLFRQKSDNCWRANQDQVDCGRLSERTSHRVSKRTGKKLTDTPPQVRVSVKGLKEIRQRMIQQPALFEIEAA
jgi:anti-repressor protein